MGSQQQQDAGGGGPQRRPFCDRCSKPLRLCLCSLLKSPPLDNPVAVTILQHSLEKHHPLNSTRLARLGLKNLRVVPVTDVNFTADFTVRPINSDSDAKYKNGAVIHQESSYLDHHKDGDCVEAVFDKYKVACSAIDIRVAVERTAKPDISWVLDTPVGQAFTSCGFTVRKLQRKQLPGSEQLQEFEEFNITVPPGTALLFPSGKSVRVDEVGFEVKHLIVLDGTWAKAQRMYHENPWLKLLPHLKLDPGKESLYSEVRHQPKAGCLSTIESIVCAMKGLGSDLEGLDELLGVFESMIGDQRRCKDEKFAMKAIQ